MYVNSGLIIGTVGGSIELGRMLLEPPPVPPARQDPRAKQECEVPREVFIALTPVVYGFTGYVSQVALEALFDLHHGCSLLGLAAMSYTSLVGTVVIRRWQKVHPAQAQKVLETAAKPLAWAASWFGYNAKRATASPTSVDIEAMLLADWTRAERAQGTDFIVRVGKQTFPVHKSVLINRSEYFRRALSHGLKEAQTNEFRVEEQMPRTVEITLRYLYCLSLKDVVVTNFELVQVIALADQWQIPALQRLCETEIETRFTHAAQLQALPKQQVPAKTLVH